MVKSAQEMGDLKLRILELEIYFIASDKKLLEKAYYES